MPFERISAKFKRKRRYGSEYKQKRMGQGVSKIPEPSGKYNVGFADYMTDKYTDHGLFLRLHYPTQDGIRGEPTSLWLPREEYHHGLADVLYINRWLFGWMAYFVNSIRGRPLIPAVENQAPSIEFPAPLVVFSHGLGLARFGYSAIATELASQGFVVANVEHRDGSALRTYKVSETGEDWVDYQKLHKMRLDSRPWLDKDIMRVREVQVVQRSQESSATVDFLTDLNAGTTPPNLLNSDFDLSGFKDKLDLNKICAMGHSFGGGTTVRATVIDSRFKVGIALDAWVDPLVRSDWEKDDFRVPILFINMDQLDWHGNVRHILDISEHGKQKEAFRPVVTVKGSVHNHQSDVVFVTGQGGIVGRVAESASDVDAYFCHRLNIDLILAFLADHLGIEHEENFESAVERYKEILVEGTTLKLHDTENGDGVSGSNLSQL